MARPTGLVLDGIAFTATLYPGTTTAALSVGVGFVGALLAAVVRYRYSTQHALFYLTLVALSGLSPLSTSVLGVHPSSFVGGFAIGLTGGVLADYLYAVVTGSPTGAEAFRTVAAAWIDRLRDRRRRVRRRLEAILDRKTVIAVLVGMPLSEFVKVTVVRLFAADPIQWRLAWAHLALVLFGLAVGIHWEHIKEAASDAGDHAEEVVGAKTAD